MKDNTNTKPKIPSKIPRLHRYIPSSLTNKEENESLQGMIEVILYLLLKDIHIHELEGELNSYILSLKANGYTQSRINKVIGRMGDKVKLGVEVSRYKLLRLRHL